MKRLPLAVVLVSALAGSARQASASGFPGQLDEFCRTAEYIAVGECVQHAMTTATLEVEAIYKAPKADPKPEFIHVEGFHSSATRFSFRKGKRYFAFVFKNGRCDRQGSHLEIEQDNRLGHVSGYRTNDLICLEEGTDTLSKLTRQVERVLSGEYERELIARIYDENLSDTSRRESAIALSRTRPSIAVEPLADLLLEISQKRHSNGSSRAAFLRLLELDSSQARELSIRILSNTPLLQLHFEAAEVLARPECKLENPKEHYAVLVKAAHEWEKGNPNHGYVNMLPVFINNGFRTPEVEDMLLAELSSSHTDQFDLISQAAIRLQFPESAPLFWKQVKKERLVSDLVGLDRYIASYVGASTVHSRENYPRLEVWMGVDSVRKAFPEYAQGVADAEAIRVGKSLLFLVRREGGSEQSCLYVGFARKGKKIYHKAFVLLGGK